jgi:hypothetical protein
MIYIDKKNSTKFKVLKNKLPIKDKINTRIIKKIIIVLNLCA